MEEINHGRRVITAIATLIMLCYLILWIVMPTSFYTNVLIPKLNTKLNSTYFGTQGPTILIFTSPVILVAILGSLYLHVGKQAHDHKEIRKRKELAKWRRPMIVKGPLGIVSGVELSFLMMFVALLIWSLSTYLQVGYAGTTVKPGQKPWAAMWDTTMYMVGWTGNICLSWLFYPVTRGSTILPLLGLTSEGSIKYHIWLGNILMTIFTTHGLGYLLLIAVTGQFSKMLEWEEVGVSILAGELSLLSGLILWIATFPRVRRKMFEAFFYTHYLYILFMLFFFLHVGISNAFYALPGFYLFVIDRYLRFLQSRQRVRLLSARVLPGDTLELNFAKSSNLSYRCTSIIFVNIAEISKIQWHPFTVTSNSNLEDDRLSVVIKVEGSWTRKLYDMVTKAAIDHLDVSVEGPYGPASNYFQRYETLVLISGGSGITPFFSIIRDLIFTSSILNTKTPKIILISSFKNSSSLCLLNLLLPHLNTPYDLSKLDLQIKAYVTRENQPTQDRLKQPRIISFKPLPSDAPISPCLGKTSHLWLAAIILSSFVTFLLFVGLLTSYYIYPIDHNTDAVFSTSKKSVFYLLIMFTCIGITSSFAFIWNKKNSGVDDRESRYCNADTELGSLPCQSLLESTHEVHYGERPDLKRLLIDLNKGSSVGVLASGPKGLRHEVASICSSRSADNLHFESISFTW